MSMPIRVCVETDLKDLPLRCRGKVRDIYDLGDTLLMIATDRISAFDVVLPTPIPMKGAVLTQLSRFWFGLLRGVVPNHLVSADVDEYPAALQKHRDLLRRRSMLVRKAEIFPVECVARGYLSGSAWKEYQENRRVCGIELPAGLRESSRLDPPLFTPATKAKTGHDINISFDEMAGVVGRERAERLRSLTLELYTKAAQYAFERGIIIADTKFEFGLHEGEIILCDEALTPDSSRFWPRAGYREGRGQPSFDKQYVRDYLELIGFNKQPPGPELPDEVVRATTDKYLEAYRLLTGFDLM